MINVNDRVTSTFGNWHKHKGRTGTVVRLFVDRRKLPCAIVQWDGNTVPSAPMAVSFLRKVEDAPPPATEESK